MTFSNQSYRIIIEGNADTFVAYNEQDPNTVLMFRTDDEGLENLIYFIQEVFNGQTPLRQKLN